MQQLFVKWDDDANRVTMGPQSVAVGDGWLPYVVIQKVENHETQRPVCHKLDNDGKPFIVQTVEGDPAPTYTQRRESEYPSLTDQLDYIYHNGVDAWKADIIDPIKAAHPKPSE
jgi:hypothetical protein